MTLFAWDLETFLIAPTIQSPPVVALGFKVDDGPAQLIHVRDPAFRTTFEWAMSSPVTWSGHNTRFDLAALLAHEPEWVAPLFNALREDRVTCTMIRENLIRIARADGRDKFDLASCCRMWDLDLPLDKEDPWRLRYGTLYNTPVADWPAEARHYLELDAIAQHALHTAQDARIEAEVLKDQYRQTRASLFLYLTQCWGVRTDQEQVERFHAQVLAGLEEDRKACEQVGLVRPNGTKDKKAAEARIVAAYAAQGREAPRGTPTEKMVAKGVQLGNVKLDAESCDNSGDPLLEAYTRFSQADTLIGKVERLRHPVIQASYNTLVNTGRTSCRQGSDPKPGQAATAHGAQMQNPPRAEGVRECFVAREGHAIVSVDFDAFEMRTWAQCCIWMLGYSKLADVLNDPKRCPHVEMGAAIRGLPMAKAYELKQSDPKLYKLIRQIAKGPNFGLPGGMGALRLIDYCRQGYGVILTLEEAKRICQLWRETWPEAQPYLDLISRMVGPRGGKTQITQHRSGRVRGGVGFCDAANGYFQGLAADAAKAAGWALTEEMYEKRRSPLYGCRPLAFVHDEFLVEVPLSRLDEAGRHMAAVQTAAAQVWVPDVKITASPSAMLRWSKAAGDPVFDSQGRLIPWEWREQKKEKAA